ncbi:hypothetical protein FF2_008397 [Malus domestica]
MSKSTTDHSSPRNSSHFKTTKGKKDEKFGRETEKENGGKAAMSVSLPPTPSYLLLKREREKALQSSNPRSISSRLASRYKSEGMLRFDTVVVDFLSLQSHSISYVLHLNQR